MSWSMVVYCRRNGITRDAGVHRAWEHEPSAQEIEEELRFLRKHYDQVSYEIQKETPAGETGRKEGV